MSEELSLQEKTRAVAQCMFKIHDWMKGHKETEELRSEFAQLHPKVRKSLLVELNYYGLNNTQLGMIKEELLNDKVSP